jgi:hypothetical protein
VQFWLRSVIKCILLEEQWAIFDCISASFRMIFLKMNILKTKCNLLYIRNQSAPRSKHFSCHIKCYYFGSDRTKIKGALLGVGITFSTESRLLLEGFSCKCIPLTLRAKSTIGQFVSDLPKIKGPLLEKPCTFSVVSRLTLQRFSEHLHLAPSQHTLHTVLVFCHRSIIKDTWKQYFSAASRLNSGIFLKIRNSHF